MSSTPSHAVILAAGRGVRLKPLTDECPKALVPVAGRPILQHIFEALHTGAGVRDFTVVVGYRAEAFETVPLPTGCTGRLLRNPEWETTGSMYSLALARETLRARDGCYIVEGDCCFDARLLQADSQPARSVWFVRPFSPEDDGCALWPDSTGCIRKLTIEARGGAAGSAFKSCGVLRLRPQTGAALSGWLDAAVTRRKDYFDLILGERLAEAALHVAEVSLGAPWQEVDNAIDLQRAEQQFGHAS